MDNIYKRYFLKIIDKYNKGIATKEEIEFLESYDKAFDLKDDLVTDENEPDFQDVKYAIKNAVDTRIDKLDKKRIFYLNPGFRYSAAAAVLLLASVVLFFVNKQHSSKHQNKQIATEIHPGGNKATLTLSNGSRIVLDNAHNGQIAKQANINITKSAGNQIVYVTGANTPAATGSQSAYQLQNTISTPNGGQYQLILPDGTKVMLNATTSLTYPAEFHGNERVVQLTGEAYFEVAKNKKMPFRVIAGTQTVEVLGTHFNINAYHDEAAVKTTLLEGSVKVSSGVNSVMIIPGEQAVTNTDGSGNILKHTVDVDKETAWKNGLFSFQNDDLKAVMRQVARWYDVKVVYAANLPHEKFIGEISRSSNLSDVIKILELNDVHFDVQGKTIIVSAKK